MPTNEGWTEDGYPKAIELMGRLYVPERSGHVANKRQGGCWEMEGDCPECGHLVICNGSYRQNFCGECGLRLVW